MKFSHLFLGILKTQLQLKGIIVDTDWDNMKNDIIIDYMKDNHFTELKESELLRERLQTLDQASQYVGSYFSREWIMKNVLQFTEEEIENECLKKLKLKRMLWMMEMIMKNLKIMNNRSYYG